MPAVHPLIRLVRRRLRALAMHLPGALEGNPKALHKARVASRRLREVLPILALERGALPRERIRKSLRRVTRTLGKVRELDVTLWLLGDRRFRGTSGPAAGLVRAQVRQARKSRRHEMTQQLVEIDLAGATAQLRALAEGMSEPRRERRWRAALARRVARRATTLSAAVSAAGSLYAPEALHRARVATKQLRYALELADETGAAPCRAEVRTLRRVQDALGYLHDLQVLDSHVRDADARAPRQSKGQAASLVALAGRVEDECRRLHAHYVSLSRGLTDLCDRAAHDIVPRVRASAVEAARPDPIKMTLVGAEEPVLIEESVSHGAN